MNTACQSGTCSAVPNPYGHPVNTEPRYYRGSDVSFVGLGRCVMTRPCSSVWTVLSSYTCSLVCLFISLLLFPGSHWLKKILVYFYPVLPTHVCAPCACIAQGGQKRASNSWELEFTEGYQPWRGCWGEPGFSSRAAAALNCRALFPAHFTDPGKYSQVDLQNAMQFESYNSLAFNLVFSHLVTCIQADSIHLFSSCAIVHRLVILQFTCLSPIFLTSPICPLWELSCLLTEQDTPSLFCIFPPSTESIIFQVALIPCVE